MQLSRVEEHTKDLVRFTETKVELVLLHQLAILFGSFDFHGELWLRIDVCNVVGGFDMGFRSVVQNDFLKRLLIQAFAAGRIDKRLSSASWDEQRQG